MTRLHNRPGFTLAEVLVVLGIVGLLLAILLPTLGRARDAARRTRCASNQRQIAQAALTRATQWDGFLPLAGRIAVPAGTAGWGSLPLALGDAGRRRYVYVDERGPLPFLATQESVAPFPAALLAPMGQGDVDVTPLTLNQWEQVAGDGGEVFLCPDATPAADGMVWPTTSLMIGNTDHVALLPVRFDFALNEGVLGFDHDPAADGRRLRGNASRVGEASRVALLGDANSELPGTQLMTWKPSAGPAGEVTLADALAMPPGDDGAARLDPRRHRGRANFAFADGHVDARPATDGGPAGVLLLGG